MALSPDDMREKTKAVVIVQATPFNKDGSLDLEGLKTNTQFLKERCGGKRFVLVPAGSTGEFYAMSETEHIKVIETVIETTGGAIPVVAGTGAAGTGQTIALSRAAEKAGADGVQVVLPFYHVPSEEGLYRHYASLADAVNIGVMIYNNTAVSKLWMPPHIMAAVPNIRILWRTRRTPRTSPSTKPYAMRWIRRR
jgi:4-hydroxy-tetrahydrodipicolinate synthase